MERQEKGSNFYMLTAQILNDKNLNHAEKLTMAILNGLADEEGKCYPSNEWLQDKLDVKETAVKDILKNLEKHNYIKRETISCVNNPFKKYRIIYVCNNFKLSLPESENRPIEGTENRPTVGRKTAYIIDKKELIDKKEKKAASPPKKAPLARPITLNATTEQFEGISEGDLQNWQSAFPAVNIRKELQEARIWALTTHRSNYRKSLNTWMSNVNKAHTTPPKKSHEELKAGEPEDRERNKKLAESWEREYQKNPQMNYHLEAGTIKVSFGLPDNSGYSIEYDLKTEEFVKKCLPAMKRMRLGHLLLTHFQKNSE